MLTYFLFVVGFVALIKGADALVDGSSSIAKRSKIPPIVIGLTIVAFGTSAPEFIVSMLASAQGSTDIAIGNILGSNIANILLVLGITAIIYPVVAKNDTVLKEIPFSLLAALAVGVAANDAFFDGDTTSALTRSDGLIFLLFFIIFLYYSFDLAYKGRKSLGGKKTEIQEYSTSRSVTYIVLGLVGLTLGGKWIVEGAVQIADTFNLSQTFIAVSVIAIGTSLPELATSVVAALKKQTDIAIGNIVGSNIFNLFWVLGMSAIVHPLSFNIETNSTIFMTIFASVVLLMGLAAGKIGKRKQFVIDRREGIIMLVLYVTYIVSLIWI